MVRPLTKKRRVRTSFDGQHVKGSKTLVKSSWEHFYHNFVLLWGELIHEKCSLLKFEILRVIVTTHGLAITSILFPIVNICRSPFKCNYMKNKKHFLGFLFQLLNIHQILNIFKKKKIVIASVFPKLKTVYDLVRTFTKKRIFRRSFESEHFKGLQKLVKSSWEGFYDINRSLWEDMIWKISPW